MESFLISEIAFNVAQFHDIKPYVLKSGSRRADIVRIRDTAIYLAYKKTDATLSEIGFIFNRSHSAIIHSIKKAESSHRIISCAKIIWDEMIGDQTI